MNYLKENSNYEIIEGKKTIKCKISNKEFIFDVVCAFQYRQYDSFINEETKFVEGNIICDQYGNRIINFPKQSYINSINKNKYLCNGKYKETVRIIKNIMKNKIDKQCWIPSFALESIIYNVENKYFFESNKKQRCISIIDNAFILVHNNWNNLLESNELLFVKNINGVSQKKIKELFVKLKNILNQI